MIKEFLKKIFKIHSPSKEWMNVPSEYNEKDTECDLCPHKDECDLIETTRLDDTRRHFVRAPFYMCRLEEEASNE